MTIREMHIALWWGNMENKPLVKPRYKCRENIKMGFGGMTWNVLVWLRTGTWTRY